MSLRRAAPALAALLLLGADVDPAAAVGGLREALQICAREAVARLGRTDGFLADPARRIPLPERLEPMARDLRRIGLKGQVHEFERALNRSAEGASGEALDALSAAIAALNFADARALLAGDEAAATRQLRAAGGEELSVQLAPSVARAMARTGLVAVYERLLQHWRALAPGADPQVDLGEYVTRRTLEGLLGAMAEHERRIRSDPAARTTEGLRRAFGAARS